MQLLWVRYQSVMLTLASISLVLVHSAEAHEEVHVG